MQCSIEGCTNQVLSRGWCSTHYMRWYRYGDPFGIRKATVIGICKYRSWKNIEETQARISLTEPE